MPQMKTLTTEERELGKTLAKKAGLDPAKVLEDFDVQSFDDVVQLTFEVVHTMPRAEFAALVAAYESKA